MRYVNVNDDEIKLHMYIIIIHYSLHRKTRIKTYNILYDYREIDYGVFDLNSPVLFLNFCRLRQKITL